MYFQIRLSLGKLQVIRDLLYVRKMTEKSLKELFEQFVIILTFLHVILFSMHIKDPSAEAHLDLSQI